MSEEDRFLAFGQENLMKIHSTFTITFLHTLYLLGCMQCLFKYSTIRVNST